MVETMMDNILYASTDLPNIDVIIASKKRKKGDRAKKSWNGNSPFVIKYDWYI